MKKQANGFIALALLIGAFWWLYKTFEDRMNALAFVWVIVLAGLFVCLVIRQVFILPKVRKDLQQEVNLSDYDVQHNKSFHREARKRAGSSIIGELAGYFWIFFIIFLLRAFIYEPFKIPSGSMQPTLEIGDYIGVNKHKYKIMNPITQKTWIRLSDVHRGDIVVFKSPEKGHENEDWIKRVIGIPGDVIYYDEGSQQFLIIQGCELPTTAATDLSALYDQLVQVSQEYKSTPNGLIAIQDGKFKGCTLAPTTYSNFSTNTNYYYHKNYQNERVETLTDQDGNKISHYTLQNPNPFAYSKLIPAQPGLPNNVWIVPQDYYFMIGDNRDNSNDSRFVGFVNYESIVGKAEFIWFSLKYSSQGSLEGVNTPRIFTSLTKNVEVNSTSSSN